MSFRQGLQRSLHHLYDLCEERVDVNWGTDRPYLAAFLLITILTGPLYLFASWIQHWNASCPWDREDHWAGTNQFAITFAIVDALLVFCLTVFHTQIFLIWPHFSWILVLYNPLVWYVICALLSPTLALILEHLDPRTRPLQRVLLPGEQPQQPLENTKVAKPARKKAATNNSGATPKKRKKGRARPLGELLLEEKALREQQVRAGQQQLSPTAPEGPTLSAAIAAPSSPPSFEPTLPKKPDRGKRESLKELF